MKLVDILARELKAWPENCECVWQVLSGRLAIDKDRDRLTDSTYTIARDWHEARVTRAEWQAAVDALNSPKVVEWDGIGLPPVGSASCEYLGANKYDEWTVVNIFAHRGHTVFVDFGNGWRAEEDSSRFRPIRTAEQVAAEEREAEDNEVMSRYMSLSDCEKGMLGRSPERVIIGLMRVMGYRKEPKPCGS